MVNDNRIIFIIQSIYIVSSLLDINWFFFGMEEFKLTVVRNIIIKIASALSIFIFVKKSNDLYLYSLILALGNLISQIVLWVYLKRYVKFVKVTKEEILTQIKPILILFIPVISISIYKIMDKIMLGSMSNMIEVGYFENSEKIMNIPLGFITALGTVMLPKMSNLYANGNESEGKKYIGLSLDFIMFISFGSMFGLIGVSPVLVPIFLGDKFINCITYGLNQKSTITISSVMNDKVIVDIQRNMRNISNQNIEMKEISVDLKKHKYIKIQNTQF